jgi:two-component system, NarL family, nitrate/nitrite response regulator NarL
LVAGTATTAESLLELLNKQIPDLLLLDIEMPGINGLEVALSIRNKFPALKIVLLSGTIHDLYIKKAINSGVSGYFHKSVSPDYLLQSLHQIMLGESFFPMTKPNIKPIEVLSKREKEILTYLGRHKTNIEIAKHLNLSVFTVDTHRKNIMQKLGFKKPGELMQYILENGFG